MECMAQQWPVCPSSWSLSAPVAEVREGNQGMGARQGERLRKQVIHYTGRQHGSPRAASGGIPWWQALYHLITLDASFLFKVSKTQTSCLCLPHNLSRSYYLTVCVCVLVAGNLEVHPSREDETGCPLWPLLYRISTPSCFPCLPLLHQLLTHMFLSQRHLLICLKLRRGLSKVNGEGSGTKLTEFKSQLHYSLADLGQVT